MRFARSPRRRPRRRPGVLAPPPLRAPSPLRDRGLERLGRRHRPRPRPRPAAPRSRRADAGRGSCPSSSAGRPARRHRRAGPRAARRGRCRWSRRRRRGRARRPRACARPCAGCDAMTEVHNSPSSEQCERCYSIPLCVESWRATSARTLVVILTIVLTIIFIRTLGQAAVGRVDAAGRGAAARLHRPRQPADDAGAVAVRRRRRDAVAHVPRERDDDLVRERRVAAALRPAGAAHELAGAAPDRRARPLRLALAERAQRPAEGACSSAAPTSRGSRRASSRARATASAPSSSRARRATPPPAATSSSSPRAAASSPSPPPATAASTLPTASRFIVLDKGQRNEQDASNGEKTLSRFESFRVAGRRADRRSAAKPCRRRRGRRCELLREPTAAQPRRAGLAPRAGAGRGEHAAARHRHVGLEPAPREQLEPAVRPARLLRVLQLHQPDAGLGRAPAGSASAPRLLATHGGAFVLALGLLWWREHGAARGVVMARRRVRRRPATAAPDAA